MLQIYVKCDRGITLAQASPLRAGTWPGFEFGLDLDRWPGNERSYVCWLDSCKISEISNFSAFRCIIFRIFRTSPWPS